MQFPESAAIPFLQGDFAVSGSTTGRQPTSHGCGTLIDELGNLVVYMLEVSVAPERSRLATQLRNWLEPAPTLHELLSNVQRFSADPSGTNVARALAVLRLSRTDACVEVLNAGLAPIVEVSPRGTRVFEGRAALTQAAQPSYPYELLPLIWNTTWLLCAGASEQQRSTEDVLELSDALELETNGRLLSRTPPSEWPSLPPTSAGAHTVVAVSAILPTRRPPSSQ